MKITFKFWVRFCAFAAVVLSAFFLIRLMRAPGTQGLLAWNPSYRSVIVAVVALGAVPFLLAVVFELLLRRPGRRGVAVAGWITLCVSALCAAVGLFGTLYLSLAPKAIGLPPPKLNILDPAHGVPTRVVPEGEPYLRLAFSSDGHWGSDRSDPQARARTLRSIDAGGYDAFFLLGDISEMGFPEQGLRQAAEDLERLVPDVPIRPMLGNHDALVNGAVRWKAYFFPEGHSSDSGSPYYYRMDAGKTHILVLDLLWGEEDFDADQRAWLIAQLESIPRTDAVVALSHCFFYASGYDDPDTGKPWYDHPGTIREVAPILEKYGVDLVVSGHNHYMEFLEKSGVAYAVVGALGGKPDPEPSHRSPASKWIRVATFGFLEADAYPDHLELIFRDSSGAELHRELVSTE